MKRTLKILAILAGAFAVLLIAAGIALRIFLPPEKAKALIEKQAAAKLHREIKVGDVSVGVISGLKLTKFALSESPTFSKGTFVSSDELRLRVALLPLIRRQIVIS